MRTGEVFALTWNDIDLESRIIKVNKTVYAKNKNPIGRWYIGTTKTEGSEREIYICDTLYSILFDYKEQQDRNKKKFAFSFRILLTQCQKCDINIIELTECQKIKSKEMKNE